MDIASKTMLFVDDRPDSVVGFRDALDHEGAKTKTRRSINSALREIRKENFDLIIIDLFLPNDYGELEAYGKTVKMNGNNQGELLACHLREQYESVPYLYLTSQRDFYSGDEDGLVFLKSPAQIDPFIDKIREL